MRQDADMCGEMETRPAATPGVAEPMAGRANAGALTDAVIAALRTVRDPEIPVNVYDLGLIYRIEMKEPGGVEIDMTLTAPGCPVAGEMLGWVRQAVSDVATLTQVNVNLVFDPPWDQARMSDEAKLELGLI
jgi:FeS assembly SUF system protein